MKRVFKMTTSIAYDLNMHKHLQLLSNNEDYHRFMVNYCNLMAFNIVDIFCLRVVLSKEQESRLKQKAICILVIDCRLYPTTLKMKIKCVHKQ